MANRCSKEIRHCSGASHLRRRQIIATIASFIFVVVHVFVIGKTEPSRCSEKIPRCSEKPRN